MIINATIKVNFAFKFIRKKSPLQSIPEVFIHFGRRKLLELRIAKPQSFRPRT